MDFTISDEMKMVTEAVGKFVREKVQPLECETEENEEIPADKLAAVRTEAGVYVSFSVPYWPIL